MIPSEPGLGDLLVRLRQERVVGGVDVGTLTNRAKLLAAYKKTPDFRRVYQMAARYFVIPLDEHEMIVLNGRLAGSLFQGLACLAFSDAREGGEIVISTEKTLEFYKELHPNRRAVTTNPFGLGAIEGISVPDGLGLDIEGEVIAVYEYSARRDPHYFASKKKSFLVEKDRYPQIFGRAELKFVTPTFIKDKPYGHTIIELPFTHLQLSDFRNSIYAHFRPDIESATLGEIQQRVGEQVVQGREYSRQGRLWGPYAKYMRRFGV